MHCYDISGMIVMIFRAGSPPALRESLCPEHSGDVRLEPDVSSGARSCPDGFPSQPRVCESSGQRQRQSQVPKGKGVEWGAVPRLGKLLGGPVSTLLLPSPS